METNRLEAFSDGVFAIAITLLVLDLRVPRGLQRGLTDALLSLWPSYAGYLVSFMIIGIIWVNHHAVFRNIARADRPLLFLNLLLLLFVVAIPFATGLLAEYVRSGPSSHPAALVYSAVMLAMGISFGALWLWAAHDGHLLAPDIDPAQARGALRRFGAGNVAYLGLTLLALVSAPLTLLGHFLVAVFYIFDQLPVGRPAA
jgi:uncharacterized membrane protein